MQCYKWLGCAIIALTGLAIRGDLAPVGAQQANAPPADDPGNDSQRKTLVLATDEEVERMPLFGTLVVETKGAANEVSIDLGTFFLGKIHQGRVAIVNSGNSTVSVGRLMSSCGCTLAQHSSKTIEPGEKQYLLIQIAKRTLGSFVEKIECDVSGIQHRLLIKGAVRRRVTADEELVIGKQGLGTVHIDIHDEATPAESFKFEVVGGQFTIVNAVPMENRVHLTLKRMDTSRFTESVHLIPVVHADGRPVELSPLPVHVRFSGIVRAVPSRIYVTAGKPLRVFLFGDVEQILARAADSNDRVSVHIEAIDPKGQVAEDLESDASIRKLSRGVSLTFQNPIDGDGGDEYTLNSSCEGIELSFTVRILE